MKSVIVPAPGKIEIREVETPVINAYQALVKTERVELQYMILGKSNKGQNEKKS